MRRYKELRKTNRKIKLKDVEKALRIRNISDIKRKHSPLLKHRNSIEIDSGKLSKSSMLAKMTIKGIPFLWGSPKHDYRPYDKFVTIADYCRKDFNASFVDIDGVDGKRKTQRNTYSMFYVNHLNLEQNYEWAEMFDKRLQEWRRPIA